MTDWTTGRVQDRLELAADVFAQLHGVKRTGYFNAWPEYLHSFADHVGKEPETKRPRPTPRQITEVEEAMLWLRWLVLLRMWRDDTDFRFSRAETREAPAA